MHESHSQRTVSARRRRQWWALRAIRPFGWLRGSRDSTSGILTYHHVAPHGTDPWMLNVPPQTFRRQLNGLLERGFHAISLAQLVEHHRRNEAPPPRSFVVVFDDGCQCVFDNAWPILRELGIDATVFCVTGCWTNERAGRELYHSFADQSVGGHKPSPLSIAACLSMLSEGPISFGTHTHYHRDYRESADDFAADLAQSLATLTEHFGSVARALSLPWGLATPEMIAVSRSLSISCCLHAKQGLVKAGDDPFRWPRMGATSFDSPLSLAAKLNGWYDWFRGWRGSS